MTTLANFQVMPPLSDQDYAYLRNDIIERGVLIPIEVDEENAVLDGHHRLEIATDLGLTVKKVVRSGMSTAEKRLHAVSLNLARRHLTDAQKVLVGEQIEPDVATVKEQRRLANLKQGDQLPDQDKCPDRGQTRDEVAQRVGLGSGKRYERGKAVLADVRQYAPDLMDAAEEGAMTVKDLKREVGHAKKQVKKDAQRKAIEAEPPALPAGPFRVIVADPPWDYHNRPNDSTHRATLSYPSMTHEQICDLRVEGLAHDDSVLWLWTTNSHLRESFDVLEAWGFTYKTMLTWAKHKMGFGDWLRGQTEHCLVGVRGRPAWGLTNQTTLLSAPVGEHSAKPDEFYTLVEALCPGNKCDLFVRKQRTGWAGFGDELPQ